MRDLTDDKLLTEPAMCSVTGDLVNLVISHLPEKYQSLPTWKKEKIALFQLGFNIKVPIYSGKYHGLQDNYIRCRNLPYKVYKTDRIFNGIVRCTVDYVTPDGRIVYTDELHPIYKLYRKIPVLDIPDISGKELRDITEIGELTSYNGG